MLIDFLVEDRRLYFIIEIFESILISSHVTHVMWRQQKEEKKTLVFEWSGVG